MNTPFINFGGMGPGTGHHLPGSSPKDPDPPARVGRRIPKSRVTESGIAAATPLPEPGLTSDDRRRPFFVIMSRPGGVGPAAPSPANGPPSLPVGTTPSATCQVCLPSSPLQSQPYIPTLWIGRSFAGSASFRPPGRILSLGSGSPYEQGRH
ncbi:hypothetical protein ACQKWADRAFT_325387 [Trichoderma austrokoningii]